MGQANFSFQTILIYVRYLCCLLCRVFSANVLAYEVHTMCFFFPHNIYFVDVCVKFIYCIFHEICLYLIYLFTAISVELVIFHCALDYFVIRNILLRCCSSMNSITTHLMLHKTFKKPLYLDLIVSVQHVY